MAFIPILSVHNYEEMLAKLGWYSGGVALGCIFILRHFVPPIARLSANIDSVFPKELAAILPFPVSLVGVFILAIPIALVAHAIRLHDRLSDLLRIRREFDVHYVLYPLAIASGASMQVAQLTKIKQMRQSLMDSVFYVYASSTNPLIDSHTITQALTNWSWFWIILETATLLIGTAIILVTYGAWIPATSLLIASTILIFFMRFFRLQSAAYAERQIEQVLRDSSRREAVAAAFNAL